MTSDKYCSVNKTLSFVYTVHVHVLTKEIRVVYESLANVNKRIRRINELVTSEGFVDSAHIPHTDWLKPNLFIKQWPC